MLRPLGTPLFGSCRSLLFVSDDSGSGQVLGGGGGLRYLCVKLLSSFQNHNVEGIGRSSGEDRRCEWQWRRLGNWPWLCRKWLGGSDRKNSVAPPWFKSWQNMFQKLWGIQWVQQANLHLWQVIVGVERNFFQPQAGSNVLLVLDVFCAQNDVSEQDQRWGSKTIEGSGHVASVRYQLWHWTSLHSSLWWLSVLVEAAGESRSSAPRFACFAGLYFILFI